jgi:hypothetical protein
MRCVLTAALAFCLMLVYTSPALAHGFGPTYDILALYSRKERGVAAAYRYPRFDLFGIRWLRNVVTSRLLLGGLRLLSVALFVVVVVAGLVGLQTGFNIAPTFVWVTWWVGLSFFTAFVGNLWPLVSPWRVLFDWVEVLARRLGLRDGLELGDPYPEALGVWIAVGLYLVFVWTETSSPVRTCRATSSTSPWLTP